MTQNLQMKKYFVLLSLNIFYLVFLSQLVVGQTDKSENECSGG